jgi:hypothetical protein
MKRQAAIFASAFAALVLFAPAQPASSAAAGWITLYDEANPNLDNFDRVGDANWHITNGLLEATMGGGHLVTKNDYANFEIRAEFWVDPDANSGIFIRCANRAMIGADTCYEVNIFDKRPDPVYGTGAIVNVAPAPTPMPQAGGKWNVYEITAQGPSLVIRLNGQRTVDVRDMKFARGPFTLQYGAGTVRFRKVQIRPL